MNCSSWGDQINRVIFSNVNNYSNSCSSGGYGNFISQVANVTAGQTYPITITVTTSYTEYVKVWIDFNHNGTLNDAGEEFYIGSGTGQLATYNITIPADALGGNTRMRVRCADTQAGSSVPCAAPSGTYGEVEDYTVNITIPNYATQVISADYGSSNWCIGETRNVSITLKNTGFRTWYVNGSTICTDPNLTVAASFKWNGDPGFDSYNTPPFSSRNPIPNDVAPGDIVTLTFPVTTPNGNPVGANNLSVNLIATECEWFSPVVWTSPSININAFPTADAGTDLTICPGSSTTLNGSTNTAPIPGISYTQTFDGCNNANGNPCGGWVVSGADYSFGFRTAAAYSVCTPGTGAAFSNIYSATQSDAFLTSGALGLSNGQPATLSFGYTCKNSNLLGTAPSSTATPAGNCTFTAYWSTNGINWNIIGTVNNVSSTSCTGYTFPTFTPSNGASVYIRIQAHWNSGDFWVMMDNISLSQAVLTPVYSWSGIDVTSGETTLTPTVIPGSNSSIFTLSITLNGCTTTDEVTVMIPAASGVETATICQGQSYTFDGVSYNTNNNTATKTLTNQYGCDSIVTLNLTVTPATYGVEAATICQGQSYTFDGVSYNTNNNTATKTLTNQYGCDSIVTLNLTVIPATYGVETATICQGQSYTFDGISYNTNNNTATKTLTNQYGCDSIVMLNLTVNPLPIPVITSNGNTLTTTSGFNSYQWALEGMDIPNATGNTHNAQINGSYTVTVEDANGCSGTSVTFSHTVAGLEDFAAEFVKIYPNPTSEKFTIQFSGSLGKATINIRSVTGQLIESRTIEQQEDSVFELSGPNGLYLIEIASSNNDKKTVLKLIKE
ncbi:GEVED domain-containing protein [Fluviicola sp.]|uniref:GEVED domain-containing protein n=1 Tax=Fluviicola sp. TaxID=1917219 RepID=UPI00282ADC98|nr:GEVED domain-containing protein [Fluviicola sp.]MDR0801911.1 T9SS type A sorting domain-containing protein [Fluviicola sp.]